MWLLIYQVYLLYSCGGSGDTRLTATTAHSDMCKTRLYNKCIMVINTTRTVRVEDDEVDNLLSTTNTLRKSKHFILESVYAR